MVTTYLRRSLCSRPVIEFAAILLVGLALVAPDVAFAQQRVLPAPTGSFPLTKRVALFEQPGRAKWQKPGRIVKVLDIKPGMTIADIGAGSGYFTRRFAKATGPNGKVYAVDISKDILEYLQNRAKKEGLTNIRTIVGKPDNPLLPDDSVDLAFFSETTHHIGHRAGFFSKVRASLKPNGRMAIIDFSPEAHGKGWCPHQPSELVPEWQIIREAEDAGFKVDRIYNFVSREYFVVFDKGKATWHERAAQSSEHGPQSSPGATAPSHRSQ